MKTTRRTAVILAIWTLCTVAYAGAYFARSHKYNFGSLPLAPNPAAATITVRPLAAQPTNVTAFPVQRVFNTKLEAALFAPAGLVESLLTGDDVTVTHNTNFFGC